MTQLYLIFQGPLGIISLYSIKFPLFLMVDIIFGCFPCLADLMQLNISQWSDSHFVSALLTSKNTSCIYLFICIYLVVVLEEVMRPEQIRCFVFCHCSPYTPDYPNWPWRKSCRGNQAKKKKRIFCPWNKIRSVSPIIPSAPKCSSRHFIFHRKCVCFE